MTTTPESPSTDLAETGTAAGSWSRRTMLGRLGLVGIGTVAATSILNACESGPWRSVYLQGAYELRNGVPSAGGTDVASPDTISAMPPEMMFDYLGVRLNGPKAAGKNITMNVDFTDINKQYGLTVKNGVLNYSDKPVPNANAGLKLTKDTMNQIQMGKLKLGDGIDQNKVTLEGNRQSVDDFVGMLDVFPFWFNIVTP